MIVILSVYKYIQNLWTLRAFFPLLNTFRNQTFTTVWNPRNRISVEALTKAEKLLKLFSNNAVCVYKRRLEIRI